MVPFLLAVIRAASFSRFSISAGVKPAVLLAIISGETSSERGLFLAWILIISSLFPQPQGLRFPLTHLQALSQLQGAESIPVAQLELPSDGDKVNLALALWTESLLVV